MYSKVRGSSVADTPRNGILPSRRARSTSKLLYLGLKFRYLLIRWILSIASSRIRV